MNTRTFFWILVLTVMVSCTAWSQIAVIANKGVSALVLDPRSVQKLYTMNTKTIGGVHVVLVDQKEENDIKDRFFKAIGTTPTAVRMIWMKAKLTGTGDPPVVVPASDVVAKVAATPGSIGYVKLSEVTSEVKVLTKIE
jgi:ABC-type phosphate transport system substrate-binding protein